MPLNPNCEISSIWPSESEIQGLGAIPEALVCLASLSLPHAGHWETTGLQGPQLCQEWVLSSPLCVYLLLSL